MKLFYKIDTQADCVHLQEDLDKFVKYSFSIELSPNISQCSLLDVILYQYYSPRLY